MGINSPLLAGSLVAAMLGAGLVSCGGNLAIGNDSDGSGIDGNGGSSGSSGSGGSGGSSGSGSSGGGSSGGSNDASADDGTTSQPGSDGGNVDATAQDVAIDAPPAPPGLAGFALVINGDVLTPKSCPSDDWEFAVPPGEGVPSPSCAPVVASAYLVNTGTLPMPYIAQGLWSLGVHYVPGVATGDSCQLVGVLDPGAKVDITSVYQGGTVAIVGSAEPFSSPDAGKTVSDEGTIPWPAGVTGSGGAATMYVAQIDMTIGAVACTAVSTSW